MKQFSSKNPFITLPLYTVPGFFQLQVTHKEKSTDILMYVFTKEVTTKEMKHTIIMLQKHLPTIFNSQCFNDLGLSFEKEVEKTEIGHLFEHILLEYLCKEKISQGCKEAMFSGKTVWNWNKENYGTFHISIDVSATEKALLYTALEDSIQLLRKIFILHEQYQQLYTKNITSEQMSVRLLPSLIEKQMD